MKRNTVNNLDKDYEMSDSQRDENTIEHAEFFANASHELKTPLTAIKGFNELLAINNKDENINKYIDSITRETDRMLSLIDNMLKISELENTPSISPVSVSLVNVVSEVHNTISTVISEKAISLECVGDGMVTAEYGHVYELIKNLVENAVRYNNQGGNVYIFIESNENISKIIISDNGIGIPPAEQRRIFERFYRVEKSRSQQGGGAGLGLSIAKHICALYGWQLSLKSEISVGTEITIILK